MHARDLDGERARGPRHGSRRGTEPPRRRRADTLIVSGTSSTDDVRRARQLTGLHVVPLFETVDDLHAAPAIVDELLAERPEPLEVMVGYSDSGKDSGYLAAQWAIYRAQEELAEVARGDGVELTMFHGRGGSAGPRRRADLRGDRLAAGRLPAREG